MFKKLDETDNYDFINQLFDAEDIDPGYYKDNKDAIGRIYSVKKQVDPGNWDIELIDTRESDEKVIYP
jgi:hypothetical protein